MKLIVVDCSRATGDCDDEPKCCVVIASDKTEAERLCRDELASDGFTRFIVQEAKEWPCGGLARVLYYDGRRLSADNMSAGDARAA